jgi:hypothetical protein
LSASDLIAQSPAYALPLDVLFASSAGVAYPTVAALDPFFGDAKLAGHHSGVFLGASAFP